MATKQSDPATGAAQSTSTKTVTMPYGVPGYTLHDVQREIPATEPPVLPINSDLQYIGKSPTRWDAHAKVSGSGRYTADVQLPGMLYAAMVTANVPHASIVSIDTSEASKMPGVKGVYVIQHLLGEAVLRNPSLEQSQLSHRALCRPADRGGGGDIPAYCGRSGEAGEGAIRCQAVCCRYGDGSSIRCAAGFSWPGG